MTGAVLMNDTTQGDSLAGRAIRQVVLDTETTGIEPSKGHRIVEIGCVELIGRKLTGNTYHQYINPEMIVEEEVVRVHGLDNAFLDEKPVFAEIAPAFFDFIKGAELVIHNAPFDVGFIDHEFKRLKPGLPNVASICSVLDTLKLARQKHPGQKNNLDALCKRYGVDNSHREFHGALLDSQILAEVYLFMTGGQTTFDLGMDTSSSQGGQSLGREEQQGIAISSPAERKPLTVISASQDELKAHAEFVALLEKKSGKNFWQ